MHSQGALELVLGHAIVPPVTGGGMFKSRRHQLLSFLQQGGQRPAPTGELAGDCGVTFTNIWRRSSKCSHLPCSRWFPFKLAQQPFPGVRM